MHNHSIRVLLIDDDEDDYILTGAWLSEIEGATFELDWVSTYDAALEAIGQSQHDVYLLDYRLGGRNGLELLREAIANGCSSPIILLTGQGDHEVDIEAMKAGAADYLDKSQIGAPLLEHSIRYAIERKQTEQKIREQAALLDIATDAILVCSLDNKILFWNKGAERLYGWEAEEVKGKDASELLYKQMPHFQEIDIALAKKGEWQGELHKITKADKQIIVQSRWTLVRDDEGKPKSILIVNTDITQKKQLEAQFLRTQRLESIGTLAGGIAHDLNNVLTPILAAVQILQMVVSDDRSQRILDLLETNTKRGADLIKQVLSFARGIEGQHTIIQVGHLIREIEKIAKETFPKSIDIQTDMLMMELWPVCGDATQLHQVLMNLCVNARDAMPDGGTLIISAENLFIDENYASLNIDASTGPYIVISVCDTGVGISPSISDRIFEPFFTTKEPGKGTGLGLSTVIGIVKSHYGFVNVYSEVDKGTQFRVYLPATQTSEISSFLASELPKGQGELVLVVDDELAIREITKASLEAYNYQVFTANDGIEAIALYAEYKDDISIVLTDMMMPSMDGQTVIRTLQKINPQVKIIAMSGLASNSAMAQSIGIGVKAFLSKPYTAEELLKTIKGVITET